MAKYQAVHQALQRKEYGEAIRKAQELQKESPASATLWALLSEAYEKVGDLGNAKSCSDKAISAAPREANYYCHSGILSLRSNELEEAERLFREAISLEPDYREAHDQLGGVLKLKGLLDQAIESHFRAIRIDPISAISHFHIAEILTLKDNPKAAVKWYAKALERDPTDPKTKLGLGRTLASLGECEEAFRVLDGVEQQAGSDAECLLRLAATLADMGLVLEAITVLKRASKLHEKNDDIQRRLAHLLRSTGELAASAHFYHEALKLNPENVAPAANIAALPRRVLSNEIIDQSLRPLLTRSLDERSAVQQFLRANILDKTGEKERAWEAYVTANALVWDALNYDVKATINHWDEEAEEISQEREAKLSEGTEAIKCVFLFGASRSGKTSVEAEVAKNPIFIRGFENGHLQSALKMTYAKVGLSFDPRLRSLPPECWQQFQDAYFKKIIRRPGEGQFFTTTVPHSISEVLTLARIFPSSYFVFVKRDPYDTATQIFRSLYNEGHYYAYHPYLALEHVNWYSRMIDIAAQKLPGRSAIVCFETFVKDPKGGLGELHEMIGARFYGDEPAGVQSDTDEVRDYVPMFRRLASAT